MAVNIYPTFFTCSFIGGHLVCLHILVIINNAAMNSEVHISFKISVFIFFIYISRVELLDHMLGYKTSLNTFKNIEVISTIFSNDKGMKLEINCKKT